MNSQAGPARRRWVVVALVFSFVLPFVLGQLAYDKGWFSGGATNKGRLLSPPLALSELVGTDAALQGRWWLIYVEPRQCDPACRQSHEALPRLQAGLGRDRGRVGLLVLAPEGSQRTAWTGDVRHQALPDVAALDRRLGREAAGGWYLADPMGWIILDYAAPTSFKAALVRAQDVLDDLHKLLKVSRIG